MIPPRVTSKRFTDFSASLVICLLLTACSSTTSSEGSDQQISVDDAMVADIPATTPDRAVDQAAPDAAPPDQFAGDLTPDLAPPGTKTMGQRCVESIECEGEAICAEGEYTKAHCTPICVDNTPCIDEAANVKGTCTPVGGMEGNICLFFCGFMAEGADCPGDMVCEGGAVCR